MGFESIVEEVHVLAGDLVDKIRDLIHEGNVQSIGGTDEHDNTFVETAADGELRDHDVEDGDNADHPARAEIWNFPEWIVHGCLAPSYQLSAISFSSLGHAV